MEQNHQVDKGSASRSARRDVEARKGRPRRPRLESLESRELLSVNEYSLLPAENNNTNSEPTAIVAGPDGNLWFTDLGTSEVGKITPAGQPTVYSTGLTPNSSPEGITTGPDGNLWFVETGADKIGMINPSTGAITEYSQGLSPSAQPVDIVAGPDGNLWFTEFGTNKIGRIDPTTGAITEYSSGISTNAEPFDITVGPDGNLWFTEQGTASIGRIDPTNGDITQYSTGLPANSFPFGITAGSDGNIWFTEHGDQEISKINPTTGAVTNYPISTPAESGFSLDDITTGSDGNLWMTAPSRTAGAILSFNPTTLAVTAYDTPTPGAGPYGIAQGPDGNVWFTETGNQAVGDVTPNLVVQSQPTSITAGTSFGLTVDVDFVDVNNTVTPDANFNGDVSVTLDNNPGGSTLGGTTTVTAVNGVATFSNLTLNNVGNDYTLAVSSNALTPITTGGIDVTSSPPTPPPTPPPPPTPTPTPTSPTPTPTSPTPTPTSPTPTPTSPTPTPTSPTPTPTSPTPTPTSSPTPTPTSSPTPTPTLVAEQISTAYLKHNKKGKPIGKPVVEIVLTFSAAMNPGTISNPGDLPGGLGVHEESQEACPDGLPPGGGAVGDRRCHGHHGHAGDVDHEVEIRQGGPGPDRLPGFDPGGRRRTFGWRHPVRDLAEGRRHLADLTGSRSPRLTSADHHHIMPPGRPGGMSPSPDRLPSRMRPSSATHAAGRRLPRPPPP